MSKFLEKKNPDATVASVASWMAIVAILMIVSGLVRGTFNELGVVTYSLVIAFTVLFAGAVVWQAPPFGSPKEDEPNED